MAKIIATAENFAFGPAGKLLTICKYLLEQGHQITFIGYGTAYQLAKKEKFNKILKINTDSKFFEKKATKFFEKNEFLLTAMDRSSTILAQKLNIPVIWLDTLFWWWDVIPEFLWDVDLYFYQQSINDERNKKRYCNKIKNLIPIGPIVQELHPKPKKKRQIMIAYGGMEAEGWYKVGVDSFYPYTLTKLIQRLDLSQFEKILITGNEKIINDLGKKFKKNRFVFKCLPHDKFIDELAGSELAMMVPGLETPLEAFYYQIPIIFLPPSNSSQYVQLAEYRKRGVALASIHFSDYLPKLDLAGKDLRLIMKIFLKQLHQFEKSDLIQKKVINQLSHLIKTKEKWFKQQVKNGRVYIDSLGENGTNDIIRLLNKYLRKKSL